MTRKRNSILRISLLSVPILAVTALASPLPISARAIPVTHQPSFTVLDNNGAGSQTSQSPCSSHACANGIRYTWSAGTCYQGSRFAPIAIVWTVDQKVPANSWPRSVPCAAGLQLSWNGQNRLTKAAWVGASFSPTSAGLAVCFQHAHQCNAGHCVTAGCLPPHVNGLDIFFQGGDSLQAAEWLRNGRDLAPVSVTGQANDVFWYGSTPPAAPFATGSSAGSGDQLSSPTVEVLGRNAHSQPLQTTSVAPSSADGVDFSWYLPLYESGPGRGCFTSDGQTWTSPPLVFGYTTGGALNSRVTVPTCAVDANGVPMTFNNVNFSWQAATGGTGSLLDSAVPSYDWSSKMGCQKVSGLSRSTAAFRLGTPSEAPSYPPNTLAQPPTGTDGVLFAFGHDDFKSTCWTQGGNVLGSAVPAPQHPRLGQWQG